MFIDIVQILIVAEYLIWTDPQQTQMMDFDEM